MATKSKKKVALITGITGQDGSYLAELLLAKGYDVHGLIRRSSTFNHDRIKHIYDFVHPKKLRLHYGDITDLSSLVSIVASIRPDELYNLAAQSHVKVSFETPVYTGQVDAIGVLNTLEAVRILKLPTKVYQASTSEMYAGHPNELPQDERTAFSPKSPYGAAKLYAFHLAKIYRESYGMFVVNGILFNHESERRGENFVTRKITLGIKEILAGTRKTVRLGNLDAKRDWGHAQDYVRAMYLMLQRKKPSDYVIATGTQRTVREFCEHAFREAGIKLTWSGRGLHEKGIEKKTGRVLVEIDPAFFRPNEVWSLQGNPKRARRELKWKPRIDFRTLVKRMVKSDLSSTKRF